MTSFNPLPSHLTAADELNTGTATPTYGGAVESGLEWEFVVDKHGRRSRTPSRSPIRTATEPPVHRSSSLQYAVDSSSLSQPSMAGPVTPTTSSTFPSTMPVEPTINEEASAAVARSVKGSQSASSSQRNGVKDKGSRRMVGDWQLQKTLGAGSMGKVKLATNIVTKEKCAVKIIPRYTESTRKDEPKTPEDADKLRQKDESKEVRTVREAAISLLLHHPYICGMREFITHSTHHYMVFEFIDGGQMLDYIISHGRLRERAARKFARQIGSALEYCHRNSIVHRDLKIENILISKNGNIKIIDFGLSNLYAPGRHLSTFCGSLYFAAPELLNAKVYTGPEVDVWSFGIVLYVLVCGKVPFDDQSMPALHAKIKRGMVEYPAWLSNECKSLLGRMLVTNPAERATLTEVLAHPFMNKGYDQAPASHLIHREPLRAEDLDLEIVNAMGGFTFGTPEQIHEELRTVLQSEGYLSCVSAWDGRRDKKRGPGASSSSTALSDSSDSPRKKRFSGFDFKKRMFKEEKKVEEPVIREKEPLDPTRGFDPLISIYYLAREKVEREKVYGKGQFASSHGSLESTGMASGYGIPTPSLAVPPTTHAMGFDPPTPHEFAPQPRARADDVPNPIMQHPAADRETTDIADVPTAHRRQTSLTQPPSSPLQPSLMEGEDDQQPASRKFGVLGRGPRLPTSTPQRATSTSRTDVVPSPSLPIEHRRSTTMAEKHERRVSVGSISNSMGRTTLGRNTSQQRKPNTPPDAAWLGSPREADEDPTQVPAPFVEEPGPVSNGDIKPVYLKGLFSVSTTSTKPAAVLTKDINAVLERLGIKHRPIRGGFECVHVPSIDLASVLNGDEATTSLPSSGSRKESLNHKPSKPAVGSRADSPSSREKDIQDSSSGTGTVSNGNGSVSSETTAPATPAKQRNGEEDDVDGWALAQGGGAGSSLIVRFEIYVVKVPWLPLHGIQFRRVGGDGWQYQMLAKTILRDMRL